MKDNIQQTDYGYEIIWADTEHTVENLVFEKGRKMHYIFIKLNKKLVC